VQAAGVHSQPWWHSRLNSFIELVARRLAKIQRAAERDLPRFVSGVGTKKAVVNLTSSPIDPKHFMKIGALPVK